MPMYHWICIRCGAEVDVIRSVEAIEAGPTEEELGCDCSAKHCEETYERIMCAPVFKRGDGWRGKKGSW